MKLPFYKIENSWSITTLYEANRVPICTFDLEVTYDVTEDNQEECNRQMQVNIDAILEKLNADDKQPTAEKD